MRFLLSGLFVFLVLAAMLGTPPGVVSGNEQNALLEVTSSATQPHATAQPVDTNPQVDQHQEMLYYQQWCTAEGGWHYVGDLENPTYPLPSRMHSPQNPTDTIHEIAPGIWEGNFADPVYGHAVMRMTHGPQMIVQEIIYDHVQFCPQPAENKYGPN